jgi:ferredoxin
MADVEIKFERENLSGIVPVGTYLSDAAKRMGVRFEEACDLSLSEHCCMVTVTAGSELLTPVTAAEKTWFEDKGEIGNRRLACQAKIERPGELVIMTQEKKKAAAEEKEIEDKNEQYKKEFAEMPLEKKIASLVQLEAIALGETFSFILNSPFLIFDKAMDVMAEFGFKKDAEARKATRPEEHAGDGNGKSKTKRGHKQKTDEGHKEKE